MARPSLFSQDIAQNLCDRLSIGRSLNSICKDDDMPCIATVMNWLVKSEQGNQEFSGFLDSYLRAREAQADVIFDECLDIIDSATPEDISVKKERVNTRMRMAGKLKPKKYGESTQLKHADAEGNKLDIVGVVQALDGSTSGLPKIGG